ncbi:hypothetical protein BP00DRAFT_249355 [Aspergillus indologenus CBS 114.80]|uniref:Uncharacterized protein n=1 Tax=Aspergillus indologenus CBS 114.80 TaxID=1450541 RepID=A0A2V5HWS2_9EURO|nr:hypothetical protein BP00DRAFT_249355 [Aspergillus indologenus CBS 114.80]
MARLTVCALTVCSYYGAVSVDQHGSDRDVAGRVAHRSLRLQGTGRHQYIVRGVCQVVVVVVVVRSWLLLWYLFGIELEAVTINFGMNPHPSRCALIMLPISLSHDELVSTLVGLQAADCCFLSGPLSYYTSGPNFLVEFLPALVESLH